MLTFSAGRNDRCLLMIYPAETNSHSQRTDVTNSVEPIFFACSLLGEFCDVGGFTTIMGHEYPSVIYICKTTQLWANRKWIFWAVNINETCDY